MKALSRYLPVISFTLLFLPLTTHANNEEEIQSYIKIFEGNSIPAHKKACNEFQWLGISDPRVFDLVENRVKEMHKDKMLKSELELMSWYMKALGFSGNEKYLATLKDIEKNSKYKKIRRYAGEGIDYQAKYVKWNPIIADTSNFDMNQPAQINRFANMLQSGEWELVRVAAKRIHYDHLHEDFILTVATDVLEMRSKEEPKDKFDLDSLKWISRAVAGSGLDEYRTRLQNIASGAKSDSLRKYIRSMIKKYYA